MTVKDTAPEPTRGGSADTGLLGPGSVSWQLHADPAMWIAGICSLYLQALHPLAAAGVIQHSNFRQDPIGRLARTASFVSLSTYAPLPEVEAGAARVRAVHRSLRGRDPDTGAAFRIDDPELLRWVHCAEVSTFLTVLRLAGYPLTPAQADRYLDEQRTTATLVGLHADEVPGSRAEMADYFATIRPRLRHGADAEVVYQFLHRPPITGPLRFGVPAYRVLAGHLAYSVLPDWAIEHYGRRPYPRPVATAMLRALRRTALLIPGPIRWRRPAGHVLRAIARLGPQATPSPRLLPPA